MSVTIPRFDVRLIESGGTPTRDLYRWMRDVSAALGGAGGTGTPELEAMAFEDAGIEELKAGLNGVSQSMSQDPAFEPMVVEQLISELGALRDLLAEVLKAIDGLEQGTLQ